MSDIRWPVAADYDESIQNPHLNFDDSELKAGEPEYDKYGSPAVRSGNFASVYMVETGRRKIAVRCFLRDVPDQQERYAAISHDLLGLQLPYTVNFEYVKKGIRVDGQWFPILKMDWCDGELLDNYLEQNLINPSKLQRLADKWYEMSVVLRKQGIAHGDLQHGNVMVLEDEIKLIDYDGMFVPRLAGRQANERGLEHYQHPKRSDAHFGRYLDNFSNWVMYTTILALAEDPKLCRLVNLQDKHLIFKKADFESPERSETFKLLKSHENKTIRTYAVTLENLLYFDVEKIPDFNPDKPILFPPNTGAPLVNLSVAGLPKVEKDKGYLYEPRPESGDKGHLHDQGGDKGRLFETAGDKGNLHQSMEQTVASDVSTIEQSKPSAVKKLPVSILISAGIALLIFGIGAVAYMAFTKAPPAVAKNNLILGVGEFKAGRYSDARKYFELVSRDSTASAREKSNAYCLIALSYVEPVQVSHNTEKLKDSLQYFQQSIDADKGNAEAYFARGRTYEALGKDSDALSDFQKAVEINKIKPYVEAVQKSLLKQKAK